MTDAANSYGRDLESRVWRVGRIPTQPNPRDIDRKTLPSPPPSGWSPMNARCTGGANRGEGTRAFSVR